MKCPVCNDTNLVMTDRQGIEIDYCPACRGVWLDRGELDKIIERTAGTMTAAAPAPAPAPAPTPAPAPQVVVAPVQQRPRDWDDDDDYKYGSYKYKKKKSLLGELFDF